MAEGNALAHEINRIFETMEQAEVIRMIKLNGFLRSSED